MYLTQCLLGLVVLSQTALAEDWPTYRHDTGRSGSTNASLPTHLELQWQRKFAAPAPAWPDTDTKLQFDGGPNVIVAAGRIFVPSSANDCVTALDANTGATVWTCYAGGPIRFAPVATPQRVYFVSDDGYLYCVSAVDGKLFWKVKGGPRDRWILGNERLISTWPARGAPAVQDGVVYFTAGIWPMMGIFVHAIDAETGETIWRNGGDATEWTVQPHGAPAFASVVPQGHLVVSDDYLIIPGGRSVPAIFDRLTGMKLAFDFHKKKGGHQVFATDYQMHVGGATYDMQTGAHLADESAVLEKGNQLLFVGQQQISGHSVDSTHQVVTTTNRFGKTSTTQALIRQLNFTAATEFPGRILLQTAEHVLTADETNVHLYATADLEAAVPESIVAPIQSLDLPANVWDAIVANDRLYVATTDGCVICFGHASELAIADDVSIPSDRISSEPLLVDPVPLADQTFWRNRLATLSKIEGTNIGYIVVLGADSRALIEATLAETQQPIIVVDPDSQRVDSLRRELAARGLYGSRIAAKVGPLDDSPLPKYFASLVVSDTPQAILNTNGLNLVCDILRPYGGVASLTKTQADDHVLQELLSAQTREGFEWKKTTPTGLNFLQRVGALSNAGEWTHQYGDAGQTSISAESRVQAPLGVLWFGGPSNEKILPRHGHGPAPQVAGGRTIVEGPDTLRALDVYTGRELWELELPGIGRFYDNTSHMPGAGEIGSNYVSLADNVYVVYGKELLRVDSATGHIQQVITNDSNAHWGYIGVSGDTLIAGSAPMQIAPLDLERQDKALLEETLVGTRYASGSQRIVAMNRHTGQRLWSRDARYNFRHNAIAMSKDAVFVIDRFSDEKRAALKRRGVHVRNQARLLALDLRTGNVLWEQDQHIFGTFLSYSSEHDVLFQSGSLYRDRAYDETGKGMITYRASSGSVIWHDPEISYRGPCLLWKDKIITNGSGGVSLDLLTGQRTGWKYTRSYGCNTAIGCQNLLTFRSGAAGYYDMQADAGTSNLGGFRSSCTNNLIPADGVLCAPDYTRTCNCAYQHQTSVAFVHDPEAAQWSFGAVTKKEKSVGLNFGAPGDRRSASGTLWLDTPSVGGESPDLDVTIEPQNVRPTRVHPSEVAESRIPWVYASSIEGVKTIDIKTPHFGNWVKFTFHFAAKDRPVDFTVRCGDAVAEVNVDTSSDKIKEVTLAAADSIVITFKDSDPPAFISGLEIESGDD